MHHYGRSRVLTKSFFVCECIATTSVSFGNFLEERIASHWLKCTSAATKKHLGMCILFSDPGVNIVFVKDVITQILCVPRHSTFFPWLSIARHFYLLVNELFFVLLFSLLTFDTRTILLRWFYRRFLLLFWLDKIFIMFSFSFDNSKTIKTMIKYY